jgi:hypothetical protein
MHGTPNCQLPIAKSSGSQPSLWEVGNGLFRRGWKTSMMKAGDMVTVDSYLARDSSPLAAGPERWTAMEGGCPIIADGECIGGIGIADGDWATDARIAQQAVEAIGASHGG